MNTGWNGIIGRITQLGIINLLGNEYWLELPRCVGDPMPNYKPTGK